MLVIRAKGIWFLGLVTEIVEDGGGDYYRRSRLIKNIKKLQIIITTLLYNHLFFRQELLSSLHVEHQ